jgi:hypothetical protein
MTSELDLLQQIAGNTARLDSVWIAAISGGAAVLGAFAGALVSYIIAKRAAESQLQIETARLRVTVVTTERLRWLQDIRQRLSKLYGQIDMQYYRLKHSVPKDQSAQFQQMLDTSSAEIIEQINVITLMLNPNKPEQAVLRQALEESTAFLFQYAAKERSNVVVSDDDRYVLIRGKAFDALTSIGIQTWDRIQKLE